MPVRSVTISSSGNNKHIKSILYNDIGGENLCRSDSLVLVMKHRMES